MPTKPTMPAAPVTDALTLVRAVETQDGRPARDWQVTSVDDLGWVCSSIGVRSDEGYAVTPAGRIGAFATSTMTPHQALAILTALPEPKPPRIADEDQAWSLLEVQVAQPGGLAHREWSCHEVPDLGWLFVLLRVDATVRFVVSRDGQIAATPRSDETGAATLGPLIERQAHRIPVAHLVGPRT